MLHVLSQPARALDTRELDTLIPTVFFTCSQGLRWAAYVRSLLHIVSEATTSVVTPRPSVHSWGWTR